MNRPTRLEKIVFAWAAVFAVMIFIGALVKCTS